MKKFITASLAVIICIIEFVTVTYANKNNTWDAFRPNYKVTINGVPAEKVTNHQILECEGVTYLALKDWAPILDARVSVDGRFMRSNLDDRNSYGKVLFDNIEDVKEIGKAIAEEKYGDEMTKETVIYPMEIELSGGFAWYSIYVFFNGSNLTEETIDDWSYAKKNADAEIRYFVRSGEICFLKNNGKGELEFEY